MICELNYIVLFLLFSSCLLLGIVYGHESDLLVSEVYLVDVVGTPKVEPTRVMNVLCISNHNTTSSLLDIGTFPSCEIMVN